MEMAQTVALMLAGGIAVPILQAIKKALGWQGPVMLWLSFVASVILAVLVLLMFGQISLAGIFANPEILFGASGIVMTLAQLIYGSIKDQL
jgi:hypothetical protein